MDVWKAIILGIIQGLTEFLPVSSSGHIELGKALLGTSGGADSLAFSVLVHGATVLSIIVVFWRDLLQLFKNLFTFKWNEDNQYIAKLLFSMLPIGLVGLFFKEEIEGLFEGRIALVGACLIATGFILMLTLLERKETHKIRFIDAIIIGLSQAIAILPGISRSGSTISTALALGVERERATRFSFLMLLLPVIAATLLEVKDLSESPASYQGMFLPYAAGFTAAFLSGLAACKWMIAIVKKGKIIYFSIYCFIIGAIAVMVGMFG